MEDRLSDPPRRIDTHLCRRGARFDHPGINEGDLLGRESAKAKGELSGKPYQGVDYTQWIDRMERTLL